MIQIRPVSDLRNKFTEIENVVREGAPVYLTKNGYGSMVVMSIESYSKLTESVEDALDAADREAAENDVRYTHEEMFSRLREGIRGWSELQLRYLPLFYNDVSEKISYITNNLANPAAALRLLDDIESAILERLPMCESYELYHSAWERKYPYYRIYVRNYVIYYVVIGDDPDDKVREVHRFLYKGQDRDSLI